MTSLYRQCLVSKPIHDIRAKLVSVLVPIIRKSDFRPGDSVVAAVGSRRIDRLDREKTRVNALAAISPEKAALPMWFDNDRQALEASVRTCGLVSGENARIVRIKNTASLEYLKISRPLEKDIAQETSLERVTDWQPFRFDEPGNLLDIFESKG